MFPCPLLIIKEVAYSAVFCKVLQLRVVEIVRILCYILCISGASSLSIAEGEIELDKVEQLVAPFVFFENVCVMAEERCC
jgi:hypothetical protein